MLQSIGSLSFSVTIADIVGYLAILAAIAAYLTKNQMEFVLARGLADIGFAAHFLLLGADLAGLLSLILGMLFMVRLLTTRRTFQNLAFGFLIALAAVFSYIGFADDSDAFALAGTVCCFVTPLIQRNFMMRLWCFAIVTPVWLVYAIMVDSVPGVLANLLYLTAAAIGLTRLLLAGKRGSVDVWGDMRTVKGRVPSLALAQRLSGEWR